MKSFLSLPGAQTASVLVPSLVACFVAGSAASLQAQEAIRFNRDIRPILSDNCFSCHGPDKSHRKGGLRLDIREEALKPGKSGEIALVAGNPEASELVKRMLSTDSEEVMPPPESHKTLTPAQRTLLKEWIRQGAPYEAHWAYIAPVRVAPPQLREPRLVRNAVDSFVQARLEARDIQASPEADRNALLRRLSLDLTGLPPSISEQKAFAADQSPEAYSRQVERLLASPHFGERMASQWLDVARYADTVGFHGDQNQNVWAFRDWVIASFNRNQPFDQFTIEQLAGDLLPNPTPEQLTATCFNRLTMMTREGGAQAKEYLTKYTADRVRTVATTWLGSTFGCAECHDHKFDPISTRDFYSLGAFFADVKQWGVYTSYGYTPEPELAGFTNEYPFPPEITVESAALTKRMALLERRLGEECKNAAIPPASLEQWKATAATFLQTYPDGFERPVVENRALLAEKKDPQSVPAEAAGDGKVKKPERKKGPLELQIRPSAGWVASLGLTLQPDPANKANITRSGKDTTLKATFKLVRNGKAQPLKIHRAVADRSKPDYQNGFEVIGVQGGWKTNGVAQPHQAIYQLDKPLQILEGDLVQVSLQTGDAKQPDCDITQAALAVSPFVPALSGQFGLNTDLSDPASLRLAYLACTGADPAALTRIRVLERDWLECRNGSTPVLVTRATETPLTMRVLPRGNWMDESGELVQPETPHFLSKPAGAPERLTRLDLARWMVSEQNPLTARVVINRLWRQFFGAALSLQPDELGSQGEPPSHPELLDWLAVEFREKGWDTKHMVRLLVHSHTYRQSAQLRAELREADPANRLLASQNPRRLEAEIIRDNALAISGLLNPEIGGPPVKPYQPAGYYQALQFPNRDYLASADEQQYRRAVYSHWQRTFLHPMLASFDAPSREDCVALRSNANTPQQALTLLNDPTFVEAARFWAARILQNPDATSDAERLAAVSADALSRPFLPEEQTRLLTLLGKLRAEYRARPADAELLLKVGAMAAPQGLDRIELAAWTNLCRVVLNLHETITRY